MFLGPQRNCVVLKAGCVEILGRRSRGAASEGITTDVEGLNAEGNNVGRRGVIEVNVLQSC